MLQAQIVNTEKSQLNVQIFTPVIIRGVELTTRNFDFLFSGQNLIISVHFIHVQV